MERRVEQTRRVDSICVDGGALRVHEHGGSRRRVIGLWTCIAPHNDVH
jgi:hypothetical protein